MTVLGADPEELNATAQRLLARADDYEDANQQVGRWLGRMDWHGQEADRFLASYRSQMCPQLDAAAACLRSAASVLRAQAAEQARASSAGDAVPLVCGAPIAHGTGLPLPDREEATGSVLSGIMDFVGGLTLVDSLAGTVQYAVKHLRAYPTLTRWVPYVVDKVDDLGLTRYLGSAGKLAGKILGPVAAAISLWNLPGDVVDVLDDLEDLGDAFSQGDLSQVWEAGEQLAYSGSDVLLGVGAVFLGASPIAGPGAPLAAAIGAGFMAAGAAVKVGAFVFDKFREPIANAIKSVYDFTVDRAEDVARWFNEETREIRAEFSEGVGEIRREIAEGWDEIRRADGVVETVSETFEAAAETGYEVAETVIETGWAGVKKVTSVTKVASVTKVVTGWLSPLW